MGREGISSGPDVARPPRCAASTRWCVSAVLLCLVLSSCGDDPATGNEVLIVDDRANEQLLDGTEQKLKSIELPDNRALIVSVSRFDPADRLGLQGDRLASTLADQCSEPALCKRKGIFVLVDAAGGFPMVRVGSELRLDGVLSGLTHGPDYVSLQRRARSLPVDEQALMVARDAVGTASEMGRDSGWLRWIISSPYIFPELGAAFMNVLLPSQGVYDSPVVRPILSLQLLERNQFGTWWFSILIVFVVALVMRRLMRKAYGLLRESPRWFRWPTGAVMFAVSVALAFVSLPVSYSMLAQSGARLEDATDLRSVMPNVPLGDLFASSWQPQRNLLVCLGLLVFGVLARSGTFLANPLGFMESNDQQAAVQLGLIPEWQTYLVSADQLGSNVGRVVSLPILVAIAGYGVLPGSLTVAILFSWVVQSPAAVAAVAVAATAYRNLVRLVRGEEPQEPKLPVRHSRAVVAGSTAVLVGLLSLWAASLGGATNVQANSFDVVSTTAAAVAPEFEPELGAWAGYPSQDKPDIGPFSQGPLVEYAQGVLRLRAGQPVAISGSFDTATMNAVKALQLYMGLEPTGTVDSATWDVLDGLSDGG